MYRLDENSKKTIKWHFTLFIVLAFIQGTNVIFCSASDSSESTLWTTRFSVVSVMFFCPSITTPDV